MSTTYNWIQSEKINGFYVMSGISKHSKAGSWCAWAKKTPMIGREGPLYESGEVFVEFGSDRQEAIGPY